jgi:hypothetical protein
MKSFFWFYIVFDKLGSVDLPRNTSIFIADYFQRFNNINRTITWNNTLPTRKLHFLQKVSMENVKYFCIFDMKF